MPSPLAPAEVSSPASRVANEAKVGWPHIGKPLQNQWRCRLWRATRNVSLNVATVAPGALESRAVGANRLESLISNMMLSSESLETGTGSSNSLHTPVSPERWGSSGGNRPKSPCVRGFTRSQGYRRIGAANGFSAFLPNFSPRRAAAVPFTSEETREFEFRFL